MRHFVLQELLTSKGTECPVSRPLKSYVVAHSDIRLGNYSVPSVLELLDDGVPGGFFRRSEHLASA